MVNKLKVLDLFSGIGMFSYGLEKTGLYETTAFCEIDPKARDILSKHWPDVECFKDIRHLSGIKGYVQEYYDKTPGYELCVSRPVDVITGGFPCQDVSSLNFKAEGVTGKKSGLWVFYAGLVDKIKPGGVIIENVSRLTSKGLDRVLYDLAQMGYDAEWYSLRASDFGAPCKRERVFIVAHPSSIRWPYALSLEPAFEKGIQLHSKRNLQEICDNPFGRSGSVPKPLLRGMDVRDTAWVDRLKQVGNTVYWPIVEQLGYHMYRNINETKQRKV
jgi:DNA (cytosine-5)-methyltransferase 1